MSAVRANSVDPITVEVIGSALSSIVEEMGEALVRASFSTNIKERRTSPKSVMPEGFEQILKDDEFRDLIRYVLEAPVGK